MIHVTKGYLPPSIFFSVEMDKARQKIKDFYGQVPTERSQQRYNNILDNRLRNEFLPALRSEFDGKCAYCESVINLAASHSEYDHFRPKQSARGFDGAASDDHYWWLVYDWQNIYYSCTKCNMYKSTWFPVEGDRGPMEASHSELLLFEKNLLVDPCFDDPFEHFAYEKDGNITGITSKGQTTIEIIKLNRIDLVHARQNEFVILEASFEVFEAFMRSEKLDVDGVNTFLQGWAQIFSDASGKPYIGLQRYFIHELLKKYDLHDYLINRAFVFTSDEVIARMLDTSDQDNLQEIGFNFEKATLKGQLESIKHVFIESIELHNFKCFSDLTINFDPGQNHASMLEEIEDKINEPWILFLGENGVGKSSLLKAFTIGIAGQSYIDILGLNSRQLVKNGEVEGYIKLNLVGKEDPVIVSFNEEGITSSITSPLISFVAYNAVRLKQTPPYIIPEISEHRGAKARNLFDYTASLLDCDVWLNSLGQDAFNRVALSLKDLMFLNNEEQISLFDGRAVVTRGGKRLYIDELSDGYQSIFHMAIDIMATIQMDGVPFDIAEGMIIIDEIGSHLHPRWRMEVVEKLRRTFPKMRFVVSTHEPLCLKGMKAGETVVLDKNDNGEIQAITDLPNPAELRVDQILTSDFFGLNSTIDPKTEKKFRDYYELISKDPNELSLEEVQVLSKLKNEIPKVRVLGDTLRENVIYDVVDKLLADRKNSNPFKTIDQIKKDAFLRLKNVWNLNDEK